MTSLGRIKAGWTKEWDRWLHRPAAGLVGAAVLYQALSYERYGQLLGDGAQFYALIGVALLGVALLPRRWVRFDPPRPIIKRRR